MVKAIHVGVQEKTWAFLRSNNFSSLFILFFISNPSMLPTFLFIFRFRFSPPHTEFSEDLFHLRGNSITVEVSMARLFNHSVKIKKQHEAQQAALAAALTSNP